MVSRIARTGHCVRVRFCYDETVKYIGGLGKQDSEYDNTLAEYAEFVHIKKSLLDRLYEWLVSYLQEK